METPTLADLIKELVAQGYELRAQNAALKQALVTLASGILRRPADSLLQSLEQQEKKWHQWMLEKLESENPAAAAAVDHRELEKIWLEPEDDSPDRPPASSAP
jgi:hypothetical protein